MLCVLCARSVGIHHRFPSFTRFHLPHLCHSASRNVCRSVSSASSSSPSSSTIGPHRQRCCCCQQIYLLEMFITYSAMVCSGCVSLLCLQSAYESYRWRARAPVYVTTNNKYCMQCVCLCLCLRLSLKGLRKYLNFNSSTHTIPHVTRPHAHSSQAQGTQAHRGGRANTTHTHTHAEWKWYFKCGACITFHYYFRFCHFVHYCLK